ncbi:hypothetical protein [Tunturiibacter gelidiferens]|uniref:hypothetical protein n=1 Tax=Tunturiibacter gelidiferens TaxID=3069689 RepID=UPI003D9B9B03
MIPAFRTSVPLGKELNVTALRPRLFSTTKVFIMASAAVMSSLIPSTVLAQNTLAAKPPVSPEVLAVHSKAKRPVATTPAITSGTGASTGINSEQGFGFTARQSPGPGCDLFPAPASTGAAVGLSYFGPPPSTVNPSLVGPVQLLNSGKVDATNGTITLPLYMGTLKGTKKKIWYILTDVSDQGIANELGLNFSAKLGFAENAARTGTIDGNGNIVFDKGTVDFSPQRNIVPGPTGQEFPPKSFAPGRLETRTIVRL